MYGNDIWSPALREEIKLRMFENRALRKIFELKRDEVRRQWRRIHTKELYYLFSSPNISWVIKSRRTKCSGHCSTQRREKR
jgi:hypothetical protein